MLTASLLVNRFSSQEAMGLHKKKKKNQKQWHACADTRKKLEKKRFAPGPLFLRSGHCCRCLLAASYEELDLGQLGCLDHRIVTLQNVAPLCLVVVRASMRLCVTVNSAESVSAPADIG